MAITQRTATKGTAASGAGFTVTFPTGTTTGDVLVLFVANAGTAGPAAPTGWTRYRNADSAGTGQSISAYTAKWSAGLTGAFTNAASVAAWACNAYTGADTVGITDGAGAAASSTTSNTSLPVGSAATGAAAGDYEALGYAWTSAATISTPATGTTIDATQANGTAISCAIGHNNTTSLGANQILTLGNATLSAANTRKTGVGVLLKQPSPQTATPGTASLATSAFAPAVRTPRLVTPPVAGLTIAAFAPTARTPRVATPGAAGLTLSAFAPLARAPVLVTPGPAALSLTGLAPAALAPRLVTAGAGALALTTFAPTVRAGAPVAVTPDAAALVLTGLAPAAIVTPAAPAWEGPAVYFPAFQRREPDPGPDDEEAALTLLLGIRA